MARYLLLEFDDDEPAEKLLGQINDAAARGRPYRVIGMYRRPSVFCKCGNPSGKQVRGARFGWWVCVDCHKVISGNHQILGNMLDDPDTPLRYKTLFLSVCPQIIDGIVSTRRSLTRDQWR